ncbi:DUF1254 domain-containing protein [Sphingomonas sp. R-74633]|uniref:DUF1254 domain-containing protein n=1 Tax=Sphingomonas sp. R-74633 TaxID=2751188 RepID=UPI0015D2DA25|nr:DUF1254 domain-containing protein [Sphingomonas sp. R-74633]NYT39882.1 DUF1254 domain-containing protein [Sphingomonas sp. R-74633]
MPAAPTRSTKVTEAYARMAARHVYFWAWPLVNVWNRRLAFDQAPAPGLMNGVLPLAPLNTLSMLHDYIAPEQRWVACPNQDVVYGAGIAALERSPVVLQVPDFGDRFWVYEGVDLRTDSFLKLGSMYGSKAGFYLITGPGWQGEVPKGITQVFHCPGNTAMLVPRVFQDDSDEDRAAIQELIDGLDIYTLDQFTSTPKRRDWRQLPRFMGNEAGSEETKWVFPDKFFDQLPDVLADAPARPGEEALYAEAQALLDAIARDPALKSAAIDEARRTDVELIDPLLQFRNWGIQAGNRWSTIANGAVFGTDHFTRTAVARSNILVNSANETCYLYQDLDADGARLNGDNRYEVTFPAGQTPPVDGFWSLTLYDAHHFFVPNPIDRYSLGTKNKSLQTGADGSLTLLVQADTPGPERESNWLPAPAGADFTLYLRAYGPRPAVIDGSWTPPPVRRMG